MQNNTQQQGFTLLELMVTVAVMGIMAAIALPSMNQFVANTRTINRSEQIANLFRFAKSEAVRSGFPVVVCGVRIRDDGRATGACNPNQISSGLMAFTDINRNGMYDSGSETALRTVVINGGDATASTTNPKVRITNDACNFVGSTCGEAINTGQFIFMPNGMFGYKTTATTTRANLASNLNLASRYVRFIIRNPNNDNAAVKIVVVNPNGSTTICTGNTSNSSNYQTSQGSNNKICNPT